MIIKVTGTKPRKLASPTHIALAVRGTGFWNAVSSAYGEFATSMARYSVYYNNNVSGMGRCDERVP